MKDQINMTIAPGTITALNGVGTDTRDKGVEQLSLYGDLSQMGTMSQVLKDQGFDVRNWDVHPVIQGEEIPKALRYLYDYKIHGWWNQQEALIKYNICTQEDFSKALNENYNSWDCDEDYGHN